MIKIYSRVLLSILTFGQDFKAITIGPFVVFKNIDAASPKTVNHEHIHVKQQVELLFIGMWILYGLSYLWNRVKLFQGKELPNKAFYKNNHIKAYRNIVFELEAYSNDSNMLYLNSRPKFNWIKYI